MKSTEVDVDKVEDRFRSNCNLNLSWTCYGAWFILAINYNRRLFISTFDHVIDVKYKFPWL